MINDEGYPAISGESLRIFQRWQDDPQFIFICLGRLKPTLVDQSERDLTPTFFRAQVNPLNQRRFFFWQKKGAQQRTQRRRWFLLLPETTLPACSLRGCCHAWRGAD